jgi:hypothetical protein
MASDPITPNEETCRAMQEARDGKVKAFDSIEALMADLNEGEADDAVTLRDRFAALRAAYPLPPSTGDAADKTFFDDLSGEP